MAVAIIALVGGIIAALITGWFTLRAARIQASHPQPLFPRATTSNPASHRSNDRRRRRPAKKARSP